MSDDAPLREHSFDGIQEYDHRLPRWWLGTFWLTVIFGLGYWLYYSVWHEGPNQAESFTHAMQSVEDVARTSQSANAGGAPGAFDAARFVALQADRTAIERGHGTFTKNCASCHGELGQGVIGPNLTDRYWMHGGTPERIAATITQGVPDKGMLAWQGILTTEQILDVSAYIITLQGTSPPNAKAPQGDPE